MTYFQGKTNKKMLISVISVQCYSLKIAFCMLPSVIRKKITILRVAKIKIK